VLTKFNDPLPMNRCREEAIHFDEKSPIHRSALRRYVKSQNQVNADVVRLEAISGYNIGAILAVGQSQQLKLASRSRLRFENCDSDPLGVPVGRPSRKHRDADTELVERADRLPQAASYQPHSRFERRRRRGIDIKPRIVITGHDSGESGLRREHVFVDRIPLNGVRGDIVEG
jgi:hypothetical protein